jgi:acetoin utilization deacetylase AcuC-like enzyme/GNAT superfamily N-acetyltransferase
MFRIRRVYDDTTPSNKKAIARVQQLLHAQLPGVPQRSVGKLPEQLRNPLKYLFRSILFVAEVVPGRIDGFALLLHAPILKFCYLDYLVTSGKRMGRGIGGALYDRVREEAFDLKTVGIFLESLPDDARLSKSIRVRKQNIARLRFYEKHGARPIINTAYETPCKPGEDNPPYLLFDDLGRGTEIGKADARKIVRAILERKYESLCSAEYIEMVARSFNDDPVKIRQPKYIAALPPPPTKGMRPDKKIRLVINDRHAIHHIQEIGYVEAPVRIETILNELDKTDMFSNVDPRHYSEKYILAVHDPRFVSYFKKVTANLSAEESIYPYVFPIRNRSRPPKVLPVRAGYFCIDTFTPINGNAYLAAKRAVDCALTAASTLIEGYQIAYALIRPPGHHAESGSFGGFCYFNSAAVASEYLSKLGKIAVLDIDYHHGNGQQEIFYKRNDVLTISIHGHPSFAYPYFTGFANENGSGAGEGYNINIPMSETIDLYSYCTMLQRSITKIKKFAPLFLVVCLGLDTAKEDPTGSWDFVADDFKTIGEMLGGVRLPMLVVQEGGYDTRVLGINALHFFTGLWKGYFEQQ